MSDFNTPAGPDVKACSHSGVPMSNGTRMLAPLDDPAYEPQHPPVAGLVPDVVAKWGSRTQLRWFRRFRTALGPRRDWDRFYCHSEQHRGLCCTSCWDEGDMGVMGCGNYCCCRDGRIRDA